VYNELVLIGEPIQEQVKVQLICDSLQEEIMSQSKMSVQLAPAIARNFTKATGMLKSMRNMLISDNVAELGITQKRKGGGGRGGHPGTSAGRRETAPEEASNFMATVTKSSTISP
jgi:hypothetical protein